MATLLEKKFTKVWQRLKNNDGVSSAALFKKADMTVSKKFEAYQKALATAKSGTVDDLLKLGKALRNLETAFLKHVDAELIDQVGDEHLKASAKKTLLAEVDRLRAEVRHERSMFDSRFRTALSAADQDLKKLESIEAGKKKELWKGFGIEL